LFSCGILIVIMKNQTQIAKESRISKGALSNIVRGRKRPSWKTAKRLARATGSTPEVWLDGSPEEMMEVINEQKSKDS